MTWTPLTYAGNIRWFRIRAHDMDVPSRTDHWASSKTLTIIRHRIGPYTKLNGAFCVNIYKLVVELHIYIY